MATERLLLNLTRFGSLLGPRVAASAAGPAPVPTAFDQAMMLYQKQHFAQAYAALARLADDGHPEAARIALLMRAHGTRLFGGTYPASAEQRARWRACETIPEAQFARQAVLPC
jgi:hypothetical protein